MGDRIWRYRYGTWTPRWWQWVLPMFSSDERGRQTIVQHVPPFGFVVWAFRTCRCEFCREARAEHLEHLATKETRDGR